MTNFKHIAATLAILGSASFAVTSCKKESTEAPGGSGASGEKSCGGEKKCGGEKSCGGEKTKDADAKGAEAGEKSCGGEGGNAE